MKIISDNDYGFCLAEENGKYGIVNSEGKEIPNGIKNFDELLTHLVLLRKAKKIGIL
jgi:hypothetical protein